MPSHLKNLSWLVALIIILSALTPNAHEKSALAQAQSLMFLPVGLRSGSPAASQRPRVNAPYFGAGDVRYPETAIFWFGKVNLQDNYADVRVGYNQSELWVSLSVFDRQLWYGFNPPASDLTNWDAASLMISINGKGDSSLSPSAYRFDGQLNGGESRPAYQAAFQGGAFGWELTPLAFSTDSGWRGAALNDNTQDDRGWALTYHIPFASLGLSRPPEAGAVWDLGLVLYDRDEPPPAAVRAESWPSQASLTRPASWGELRFGLPTYQPPAIPPAGSTTVRNKLNGAVVSDGAVGGGTTCGDGLDIWTQWGDTPQPGSESNTSFNVQNQSDIADWPCFSRYYVTFPLDQVPPGKAILSARLVLHQMGSSGGGQWGTPSPSYIQVFTVGESWDENGLTWNNAPLAAQNFPGAWVDPLEVFPGWPGTPRQFDVSIETAQAYANKSPLRLALYESDSQYHSGKYFVSSDTQDWNAAARPTLEITWGNP